MAQPTSMFPVSDGEASERWSGLPEHLIEDVYRELVRGRSSNETPLSDLFAACGVCKSWRHLGTQQIFEQPWDACPNIIHPLQLFSLSPRAVRGGLLNCFVTREKLRGRMLGATRFCMYLGDDHENPAGAKFMLAALQTSRILIPMPVGTIRWETAIYLNKECTGEPVARLAASWMSTRYCLAPTPHCMKPPAQAAQPQQQATPAVSGLMSPFMAVMGRSGSADSLAAASSVEGGKFWHGLVAKRRSGAERKVPEGVPPKLAMVQYSKRVQGFMRPRKIKVALPHPADLACFDAQPGEASRLGSLLGSTQPSPLGIESTTRSSPGKATSFGGRRLPFLQSLRRSTAVAGELAPAASCSLDTALSETPANMESALDGQRPALLLKNKLPRWNEGLRCWCLNFRSRVKLASVKNFQLQCCDVEMAEALAAAALPPPGHDANEPPLSPERRLRQVVMQFGKASHNVYILDYNPTVVTALQAFSIALSTFDGKLRF